MPARYISRLRLSAFRNYPAAALDLDGRHLVLTGPNGAGKTNLLEAVSMLAPGRGLRRATLETLSNHGSNTPWTVAATIETPAGPTDVGTGLAEDGTRRVRINGANARSVERVSEYMRVLWLTPAMDGLFTGPPGDRRRFLDRLVTTIVPGHSATVADYDNAMRQRNRVLQERADPLWLDAIEAEMAAHAAAVHFARTDAVRHLQATIDDGGAGPAFPTAYLALSPMFEGGEIPSASAELESLLKSIWAGNRAIDRAAGRTTLGPHTIDLAVTYRQKQTPAALGSTGEQKALLTGLVLAQARLVRATTGISPFLLLDEIAAHFDPARRAALFAGMEVLDTQCLMTGTDPLLFEALGQRAQRYTVDNARLVREDGIA